MGQEMDAAVVGAAIAGLVAVILFVIERTVARRAAYVERRRLAFEDVILSMSTYVAATIEAMGKPSVTIGVTIPQARARMTLALRARDRPLTWWITGMESRLMRAADLFETDAPAAFERIEQVNEDVMNTLLNVHLGVLREHDLITPGALFWREEHGKSIPAKYAGLLTWAEKPQPSRAARGPWPWAQRLWTRTSRTVMRSLGREVPPNWLPAWALLD